MIGTYSELVSAIDDWLDLGGTQDTRIPTYIQLTEARLNRLLEDPDMEVTATLTAAGPLTALPSDFGSMVSVSTGNGALTQSGAVEFAAYDSSITGTPRHYTVQDGAIGFWPGNNTASITMVYRRKLTPLSATAPTNWLLTRAPDAYLYGALVQAEGFSPEDDRVAGWKAMFDEAIAELRSDGARRKWGAGPIAPRIGRP